MLFRGVICCSGGLYAVQEGYMLKKIMMKIVATNVVASRPPNGDRLQRRPLVPISCSGGLYAVQGGYMLFRWVIWMFRRVIC